MRCSSLRLLVRAGIRLGPCTWMIALLALALLACGDPSAREMKSTLDLYTQRIPGRCEPGLRVAWWILKERGVDRLGFVQQPATRCVFELQPLLPPEPAELRFRVSLSRHGKVSRNAALRRPPPPDGELAVRVRAVGSAGDELLFETVLTAQERSKVASVALPQGTRQVVTDVGRGPPEVRADWSELFLSTSDPDPPPGWTIPLDRSLAAFYEEVGWSRLPRREDGESRPRLLMVGIDGATWTQLEGLIADGSMPTLGSLRDRGRWGVLNSTPIPESAMAWTTMRTGVNAGRHGIFEFDSVVDRHPSYWQRLGRAKLSSVIVAVPKAAVRPLRGVFVGGWTYDSSGVYTHPSRLGSYLTRGGYDPALLSWRDVEATSALLRQRTDLTLSLLERQDWDHAFVVYEYGDTAGHRFGLGTPAWRETLAVIDQQLARLVAAVGEETTILLVSDHGWSFFEGAVAFDTWLLENGFADWRVTLSAGGHVGFGMERDGSRRRASSQERERLSAALRALRTPDTGEPLLARLRPIEDAFEGPRVARAPAELLVELAPTFMLARSRQKDLFARREADGHAPEGIYVVAGPGVEPMRGPDASVLDVAPTVLGYFGLDAGAGEGEALLAFDTPASGDREALAVSEASGEATIPQAEQLSARTRESLRELGYLRPAPGRAGRRPDVLVAMVDTLRADHVGVYGYERDTSPNLDRFAASAVVVADVVAPSSWTLPSVASLFTGTYPSAHGLRAHKGNPSLLAPRAGHTTLAEVLRAAGYRTLAVVTNPWVVLERHGLERGFDVYKRRVRSGAGQVNAEGRRLLQAGDSRPAFLYLHYMDVHGPYGGKRQAKAPITASAVPGPVPERYRRPLHGEGQKKVPSYLSLEDADGLEDYVDAYDRGIRAWDESFGQLLDWLDRKGRLENTIVVVVSDHGEEFLERGGWNHGLTLYQEQVSVPWVMRVPGLPARRIEDRVASLVDVAPTILGRLEIDVPDSMVGRDLLADDRGDEGERSVFSETEVRMGGLSVPARQQFAMRRGSHKWIVGGKRGDRCFDLSRDPREQHSLQGESPGEGEGDAGACDVSRFAELRDWAAALRRIAAPRTTGDAPLPPEIQDDLRALGYVE